MTIMESISFTSKANSLQNWILILVSFVSVCAIVVCLPLYNKRKRLQKYLKNFPGPSQLPIIGNITSLLRRDTEYNDMIQDWKNNHGSTVCVWVLHRPWVFLMSASNVGKILSSHVHVDKSEEYDVFKPWFGTGIVSINGNAWRHRRKLLQPTYNFKRFEDFVKIANIHTTILIELLDTHCNKTFDIGHFVKRCSLDIICEMATGTRKHIQLEPQCEYIRTLENNVELMVYRMVRPWLNPSFLWNLTSAGRKEKLNTKILHGFTKREIKERRRIRELNKKEMTLIKENVDPSEVGTEDDNSSNKLLVFIDFLLDLAEKNEDYTDEHIQEDVDAFVFAGFDTTAQSINFTLFLLAGNPAHQTLVQNELDEIFGEDKNREITTQDLSQMKYLEMCIKESLRLYPSGPYFLRAINEDCELDDGLVIPSGATAFISAYHLHRDPEVFPNPEQFDPERFSPENSINRHYYAYVPFVNGPRNCMGQKMAMLEEKVMISRILLNYNMRTKQTRDQMTLRPTIILQVEEGFQVELTRRI